MWADRNGCDPDPREETISDEATKLVYDFPPSAAVELYRIEGGGHTWPGRPGWTGLLGPVTMDIDANKIMWAFFTEQGRTD
jgi:polyhydroxybutyrate depolymerase